MSVPQFLVVGEALVDIVVPPHGRPEEAPGGSPLNVAVGLSRLGVGTALLTEVGDDERGRLVQEHLRASNVHLVDGSVVPGMPTSTATALLDDSGAASYEFDLRWDLVPRELPTGATALHVGSIGTTLQPGRDSVLSLVMRAAAAGLVVTFDPNTRPAFTPDPGLAWVGVREVAAAARLVKMSDEDLAFLRPDAGAEEVARELLAGGAELVVVTFGGRGAAAFSDGAIAEVPSPQARVVDTVGAGDSFMAGLVAVAVEHGLDDLDVPRLEGYLAAAHECAGVTVSRRGADPPWRGELTAGWPHLGAS